MLRKITLFDRPEEWVKCFGLKDNPFSPTHDLNGLRLSQLDLETEALCPNRQGYEHLYDQLLVEDVNHFKGELDEFVDYMDKLGPRLFRLAPIILVHGPRGSGKSTFANVCRHIIMESLAGQRQAFQCQVELKDPHTEYLTEDEIIGRVKNELNNQDQPADSDTLALVLLKHFSEELIRYTGADPTESFHFLSKLRGRLKGHCIPLIFVTSAARVIHKSFANRAPGDRTEAHSFELGELSGNDVVKIIDQRLSTFRSRDAETPAGMPLFPFREEVIVDSFQNLVRQGHGTLPFRNVNKILASALRLKKQKLIGDGEIPVYQADLLQKDLELRSIDHESLDSAIRGHL